jgi:cytidylate kinase
MPASGKTTLARTLAARFGLQCMGGGDALKQIAAGSGYKVTQDDWWDTPEGQRFTQERTANRRFDIQVDETLLAKVKEGGIVVTSYPLPWLSKVGVKIWLKASVTARAKRLATRDKKSDGDSLAIIKQRDQDNTNLYKALYGIDFGSDLSVFDYVINTESLSAEALADITCTIVKHLI